TDLHESDDEIINKINRAAQSLRSVLSKQKTREIKKNYNEIISQFIYSPLVIAFVGESGVGKTSLLHLLIGKQAPEEHIPTISLNMETLEELRFGSYQLFVLDFAGEDQYDRIRDFTVIDMFFLVTDSSLRNIISAKNMYSQIVKDCPDIPITVFANKQDLANSLDPSAISKVLGVEARSMVAVDLAFRTNLLSAVTKVLCNHFDLEVPDVLPEDLLSFT
ncbi:MAG: GTP-binding protein, partial [Candidatus Thorarchaeota archaeon]